MLKKTLAVAALVACTAPLSAQFIGVPDNDPTMGGCNTFPMGFDPEWRYQQLIPATALPAAPFKITDLAFAPCSTSSHPGTYADFQVRMGLTTATALTNNFDANLGPCPITVLNRPTFTWAYTGNTWIDFGNDCSFAHDGVRNIVVEVRYRGGSSLSLSCHRDSLPRAYTRGAGAYTNPTATSVNNAALKIRLTVDRTCVLLASDTVSIGGAGSVQVQTAQPGAPYQIATALGQSTLLSVGSCSICLDPDVLFFLSITGNPLFSNYAGNVTASGTYAGRFRIPAIPALVGTCLYHASVTLNPTCCTNTDSTEIVP